MTISLPPSLYKEAVCLARKDGRTNSELVRESIRKYVAGRRWQDLLAYGRRRAIKTGLAPQDIEDIVDEIRSQDSA
jgi:CopG family transcriptional regulator/antitoxin EndoAI